FLSILANQIAVAIENARLYEAEKTASRQLRAAQQQLVHTERLAALGEMSAKVAHEVNNPLGIIKNYIQLLKRKSNDPEQTGEYIDVVGQEIDRIARIVRELLDFYRPVSPSFSQIDLSQVIDDVLLLMERQLRDQSISATRDYSAKLCLVQGSKENLKQVFLNIVINAIDVMPDGGELGINLFTRGDNLVTTIYDTGPGVKPEIIPHIFEPFFTTKEAGHGTGLGLSVCYGIIKKHQGSITYQNRKTGGCFTIELPLDKQ
ncbi:MAG: sensor histidine kinase, partial [Candidatus Zixiibacteriota bacterium]